MKTLNLAQTKIISGGEQYILVTSIVEIEGIPESCIQRFFNNNTNATLIGLTMDELEDTLMSGCVEYSKLLNSNGSWTTGISTNITNFQFI